MEQELGRERLGWKNVGGLGLKGKVAGGEDTHCCFISLAPLTIRAGSFLVWGAVYAW